MENKDRFPLITLLLIIAIFILGEAAVWMLQWWPDSFEWLIRHG